MTTEITYSLPGEEPKEAATLTDASRNWSEDAQQHDMFAHRCTECYCGFVGRYNRHKCKACATGPDASLRQQVETLTRENAELRDGLAKAERERDEIIDDREACRSAGDKVFARLAALEGVVREVANTLGTAASLVGDPAEGTFLNTQARRLTAAVEQKPEPSEEELSPIGPHDDEARSKLPPAQATAEAESKPSDSELETANKLLEWMEAQATFDNMPTEKLVEMAKGHEVSDFLIGNTLIGRVEALAAELAQLRPIAEAAREYVKLRRRPYAETATGVAMRGTAFSVLAAQVDAADAGRGEA